MFKFLHHANTLKKLAAILILLVLLPAMFYSAYEISSLTQSETMIEQIYRQQLDAILFSLNQYAWDIADSWASAISRILKDQPRSESARLQDDMRRFLVTNKGIEALFLADTAGLSVLVSSFPPPDTQQRHFRGDDFLKLLQSNRQLVSRLMHLSRTGYRKIEGVTVAAGRHDQSICLLFISGDRRDKPLVAGIILDAESFVRDVLRQKLDEAGGDEFLLSVLRKSDRRQIYATGQLTRGMERQTKELWLFPDYVLGIRLRGQTIEELVKDRFYRNLALLAFLDAMIIAGVWFVYRTIRREMELAQLKADFVSNVSHELRTPLSLIRMFGETLEMGRISSEAKKQEYYSTIVRESERLTALVNNVLNFSRMESGKKEFHISVRDLNQIVQRVIAQYEPHMTQLGFAVRKSFVSGELAVRADEEAVSEALLNILDNAMKYSAADKSIRVFTGRTNNGAFVEVQDSGIGIAPHEQAKIFDKFYRSSAGEAMHRKGSGLGLTLVRHIMRAHNGEVSVESQVGTGSTFRLLFPSMT